jgi:diguanylate cyclase (GGDEF)-like protein/PAS domain S-box-containing protein
MATAKEFERRRTVFDRVEQTTSVLGDRTFELSQDLDLMGAGLPTVVWIYDTAADALSWSSPVEELFGFPMGTLGFAVNPVRSDRPQAPAVSQGQPAVDPSADPSSPTIGPVLTPDDEQLACAGSVGSLLLEPVLAPLRTGVPPTDFELHLVVRCPDGTDHTVVVRASPTELPSRVPTMTVTQPRYYSGLVIDITAQQKFERELGELVSRYRLLSEVSPDVVAVHQNGRLVYGNRAAAKLIFAGSSERDYAQIVAENYGRPVADIVEADDIPGMVERLSQLTEDGQFFAHGEARIKSFDGSTRVMELTSVRTTWNGEPAFQVIARDISERLAAEAAARYQASLVAHVSDAIIGIDTEGQIESWNQAAQAIYGWSQDEVKGLSIGAVVTANRTDSAAVLRRGQHSHHRKDGSSVDVLVSIDPLIDDNAQPSGWVVVCTELTDARQAEAGRRAAEERYEAVVASLSEGIILFDESGDMSAHNQAAATILGDRLTSHRGHRMFTGDAIATSADGQLLTPEMFPHVRTQLTGEAEDGVIIGVTNGSGGFQWLSMSSRLLTGASQTDSPMVVCSFTDVTDRKEAESQLQWMAFHDSLTGLGNRQSFNNELERELMISMQHETNLAVLFIDLDRFKLVNDSFGHSSGDELLKELARRFKTASRKGDVVSRFSGDEFVVLCPTVRDLEHAVSLATEYSTVTAAPFTLSTGRSVVVTASVGVAYVVQGDQTAQDILQQADTAMFKAKNNGRSRIEVFDESLRENSVARLEIYDDLRHSIENDELVVHYQPIASVASGKIVALEALVRWNHPTRGLLGPMEFIPFAEETDLIFSLGRWVLREACQTMAHWRNEVPGAEDAYITVNLSVHQLSDASLLDTIAQALADSGLPPGGLVLEVTESLLMSETSETVEALNGIHAMGVGLAIDDFGTGESSLARLKRFPVKVLKIDKSFVDGLGILETDEAIVAAIVQLSKALGLVVLAEGVETPAQLERVAALGCDLYQGYLMSRPVSAEHVDFTKQAATTPQSDLPA